MNRYARQIVLPEVGTHGQARLAHCTALIVGAGGLGSPVLQYIAGAGIGRLIVVDPDTVERENLHRQTLYGDSQLGQAKVAAAKAILHDLNPHVVVDPIVEALEPRNAAALIARADIVLDCADSFAATYILSDNCLAAAKPLISSSVLGLSGYAGGFCAGAPSVRAVFPDLPRHLASCATAGVLGPAVGTLGAIQAQLALAVVLELAPSPLGQLVSVDLRRWRFGGFRFDGAAEPEHSFRFVARSDLQASDFVVELRGESEAPEPIRADALRASVDAFDTAGHLPRDGQRAVLCCRSGLRAWRAATALRRRWDGPIALLAAGMPSPRAHR
ncbi:MAG: HesA/MoeB/ThiF family protein [Gammaproteobacteria bacterium]